VIRSERIAVGCAPTPAGRAARSCRRGREGRCIRSRRGVAAGVLGLVLGAHAALAAGYEELRVASVERCRAIDPDESQSGLLFNPDGYRSFYVRSECFQRAAVQFRDTGLCDGVNRRWSLFSSSWGISRRHCRDLVAEGAAADRARLEEARELHRRGSMRLRDFQIERNGNGRDFDLLPSFTGSRGQGHLFRLEAVGVGPGGRDALLHASGYYVDPRSSLRIFLRQAEIRQQIPDFALGRPYAARLTLVLDVGHGGPAGYWSDTFVEGIFPARERMQSLEREVRF
jgi:hypothetical protein